MITECLIVGFGGAIGSMLRYMVGLVPIQENTLFPVNTFLINIIGTVLISIVAFKITKNYDNQNIILFLKVGLCGGFTTFSSFALETGDLIKGGNTPIAFIYVLLTVVIGIIIIFLPDLIFS